MAAIGNTTLPSTPTLLTLPPELRQQIFEVAYSQEQPYRIKTYRHWQREKSIYRAWHNDSLDGVSKMRVRSQRRVYLMDAYSGSASEQQYPPWIESPLLLLAVCKQFFSEAVEAFFKVKKWYFSHQNDLDDFLLGENAARLKHVRSVFIKLEKRTFAKEQLKLGSYCPRLESLTVKIDIGSIYSQTMDRRWIEQRWSDEAIAGMQTVRMALGCWGSLKVFQVVSGPGGEWDQNLRRVERYVMERLGDERVEKG